MDFLVADPSVRRDLVSLGALLNLKVRSAGYFFSCGEGTAIFVIII